jgi:hypothetical protein
MPRIHRSMLHRPPFSTIAPRLYLLSRSRQFLLHCSTFALPWARTSYIHIVVCKTLRLHKGRYESAYRHFSSRGGWGGRLAYFISTGKNKG